MKPIFLGMGMQRAGTTSIQRLLERDQRIWVPPVKELHYWDLRDDRPGREYRLSYHLPRRVSTVCRAALPRRSGHQHPTRRYRPGSMWDVGYFLSRSPKHRPYEDLFRWAPEAAWYGDITPSYFLLSEATMRRLAAEPSVRSVFCILRDPLTRTWSHFTKDTAQRLYPGHDAPRQIDRFERFLDHSSENRVLEWMDIAGRVQLLRRVFNDRLTVLFYDHLLRSPDEFVANLYRSLELEAPNLEVSVPPRANSFAGEEPDPAVLTRIAELAKPGLLRLAEVLDDPTVGDWLDRNDQWL